MPRIELRPRLVLPCLRAAKAGEERLCGFWEYPESPIEIKPEGFRPDGPDAAAVAAATPGFRI